jgi:hypothetical protein
MLLLSPSRSFGEVPRRTVKPLRARIGQVVRAALGLVLLAACPGLMCVEQQPTSCGGGTTKCNKTFGYCDCSCSGAGCADCICS